jgi:hypothetical protein
MPQPVSVCTSKIFRIDLQPLKLIDFYLLFWRAQQRLVGVLRALTSMFKTSTQLRLENLASRQQLMVLRRSTPKRLKVTPADRIFWVWLQRVWGDWKSAPADRESRDGYRLASQGFSFVLEVANPPWQAGSPQQDALVDLLDLICTLRYGPAGTERERSVAKNELT